MRPHKQINKPHGLSRRAFFGTAGGAAALALLPGSRAIAQPAMQPLVDDYVGRLCYNENPLGSSPLAKAAMTEQIDLGHRYGDWLAESLRGELSALHGVYVNQTVAGAGGTEMLRLAAMAFADPAGNVVCPYPSYGGFDSDAALFGAEVRHSSLDANYRVDLNDIMAYVDDQTSAVCITNPNNPTATVLPAADIAAFVDALPAHVTLVIDEAYHHYVHDPSYSSAIDLVHQDKNVVVIRTFSKIFGMAGVRCGYAVGKGSLIGAMARWQTWGTVSRLASEGAKAALGDQQHITDTISLNDSTKQLCFNRFATMGLEYIPSETNFFMVDVDRNASEVAAALAEHGYYVRNGWGMPEHLRVSTGKWEEMVGFLGALQLILSGGVSDQSPPQVTRLDGNYPNPFRESTRISYRLAQEADVRLEVFDAQGRLVRRLHDGRQGQGRYAYDWNGADDRGHTLSPGIFYYRLTAGEKMQTRRVIRIK